MSIHKEILEGISVVTVYVNDINLIGTLEELEEIVGMLVHQSNYTEKVLK